MSRTADQSITVGAGDGRAAEQAAERQDHPTQGPPAPPESPVRPSPQLVTAPRHDPDSAENRDAAPDDQRSRKPPLYKRPVFWIVASIILVMLALGILLWWLQSRYKVSTDDAFITAHSTTVSARVAGHVMRVLVNDNQDVKKGDALVELDPADFEQALASAQASLAMAQSQLVQAQAQLASARAAVSQARADVAAAQASANQAQADLARYENVQKLDPRAVSKQQVDQAVAASRTTGAQLDAARQKQDASEANVKVAQAQIVSAQSSIDKAQSDVANANLQRGYTRIYAAEDGQVTNRAVEPGNYITPGQALMALVPRDVYVIANFKETQLKDMRIGQPVKIHVDAYGMNLDGTVDSIQAGSGAAFSLLPPENATGNYVKVVQRVPVKITFNSPPSRRLGAGMSVEPTVDTKPRD